MLEKNVDVQPRKRFVVKYLWSRKNKMKNAIDKSKTTGANLLTKPIVEGVVSAEKEKHMLEEAFWAGSCKKKGVKIYGT